MKESRTGKYYAGEWEPDTSLFVFRNNNQQPGKNQPDYEVFLVPRVKQDRKAESSEESEIFDERADESPEDDWMDFLKEKDRGLNDDFEGLSFD